MTPSRSTDLERLQGTWRVAELESDGVAAPATTYGQATITLSGETFTSQGIYSIDGNSWTICLATRGDDRPAAFATGADSGLVLETFHRDGTLAPTKKKKASKLVDVPDVPSGPPTEIDGEWAMVSAVLDGKPLAPNMVAWCKRITSGGVTTNKGQAQAGIYRMDGDDLEICVAAPGDPRPSTFASAAGDGRSYTAWRRSAP
jgi:hypothetical protein